MAKSLRSKWKRRMRAEKRIRYGEKERAKLIKMVETYSEEKKKATEETKALNDAPMSADVIPLDTPASDKMETSINASSKQAFPVWMPQRRIKKMKEYSKTKKNPNLLLNNGRKKMAMNKKAQRKICKKRK
eukprot:TRINITY_DN1310_c0_g1_i1.p1 TRINITY_DN1310_c0_g1~~TRINITY_DN1310_c0_g1_i1.p1  ORF type:complete len:152 (-),score=39.86 TRINITY_DN1310_c0_g1_i1:95-487(-)